MDEGQVEGLAGLAERRCMAVISKGNCLWDGKPVRAVRCPVKSGNERDPHPLLPPRPLDASTPRGLPPIRWRKVGATAGQYAPKPLGRTRQIMVGAEGSDLERGRQSLNPTVVGIEGCNSPS